MDYRPHDLEPAPRTRRLPRPPNVGPAERVASVLAGGALAAYGLRRRGPGGLLAAILGATLANRGFKGYSRLYDRLDVRRFVGPGHGPVYGTGILVETSIAIDRPPHEVYEFWRRFENLPRFLRHLERVETLGGGRSRWVAKAPLGGKVEWIAEILEDVRGRLISWRSVPGSGIQSAGSVRFLPAPGGGTEVVVRLAYKPPLGPLGAAVARLLGEEPHVQMKDDLRRLKQVLESGAALRAEIAAAQL